VVDGFALEEQGGCLAAADIHGTVGIVRDLGFEDAEGAQPFALEGDLFSEVERLFLFENRDAVFFAGSFFVALLLILLDGALEAGHRRVLCCSGGGW
jgi:hypothetical protein